MYLYCRRCGSIFPDERNRKENGKEKKVVCPGCNTKGEENFYEVTDSEFMTLQFVSVLGNETIQRIKARHGHKPPQEEDGKGFRRDLLKWWGTLK